MDSTLEKIKEVINNDNFSKFLGIRLVEISKGYSKVEMTVTHDMLNFFNMAHGGAIFAISDAAFAAAGNSHGQVAVALCMNISYRSPAVEGMKLIAECREESLGRRTALYHIEVKSQDGKLIASSQGTVFRKEDEIV